MKKLLAIFALFLSVQFVQASTGTDEETKKGKTELTEAQKIRAQEMQERLDQQFFNVFLHSLVPRAPSVRGAKTRYFIPLRARMVARTVNA